MAAPLYSDRFICRVGLNGLSELIVVPAGYLYVIKQLTFYANPLVEPARGFLEDGDTGAALFSCATQAGTPAWFGFYGAIAFRAGQSFQWNVAAGLGDSADVYAGGYKLTSP